jgi:hypothetical protein
MSSNSIKWLSKSVLETNVGYSRKIYKFLEEDFGTCVEYVAIDEKHLGVYSIRLANLILRIGPEILRLFNLILFNERRSASIVIEPELKNKIIDIQRKKDERKDNFMDYLNAISLARGGGDVLSNLGVQVKTLGKLIVPFEVKDMTRNGKNVDIVYWWDNGYNALRHRVIEEFATSATLGHALFSLAALWVLHDILDYDFGRVGIAKSDFFEMPFTNANNRPKWNKLELLPPQDN